MYDVYTSSLTRQIIIINAWDRPLLGYYFAHLNTNNVMISHGETEQREGCPNNRKFMKSKLNERIWQ